MEATLRRSPTRSTRRGWRAAMALGVVVLTVLAAATAPSAAYAAPPTGTVRVFWLKPADVAYDQRTASRT